MKCQYKCQSCRRKFRAEYKGSKIKCIHCGKESWAFTKPKEEVK